MKHACGLLIVILLAATLGCEHDKYEIEMTTEKDSIHRKLTVSRTGDSNVADEQVAELAKLYEKHAVDAEEETHVFEGTFKGRTPSDVGGAGSLTHFDTKMGNLSIYVERFRGNDDLLGQVQRRLKAADRLIDILIGWLGRELKDQKDLPKLRAFLDKDFRRDIKNLSLYLWRGQVFSGPGEKPSKSDEEGMVRICQYFCERGYAQPEEVPAIARSFSGIDSEDVPAAATRLLAKVLKNKAKIDDETLSRKIVALFVAEDSKERLTAYLKDTPEYKARLSAWREARDKDPESESSDPPDPTDILSELAEDLLDISIFETFDELDVALAVAVEPVLTNGEWDARSGKVSWSVKLHKKSHEDRRRPMLCYAFWVEPNEAFQKKHFGKVVLEGETLAQYCLRRKSLTRKEAETWDEFVASLRPGENFARQVEAFEQDETKPEYVRELAGEILRAIEEEDEDDAEQPASRPAASTRPK